MRLSRSLSLLAVIGMVAACAEKEEILPGQRLDIDGNAVSTEAENQTRDISLPSARVNADWTHRNGNPTHDGGHVALPRSLTQVFAVKIGQGNSRGHRITAEPVIADQRIFTLDAMAQVTATSTSGQVLWTASVVPGLDGAGDASGGGLATNGQVVVVSTGFGELVALDAATGGELWVQDLDAPGTSAPTIANGLVYVIGRDGTAWVLDLDTGRVRWTVNATPSGANFSGGSGAAVNDEIAVFPFPSGEVVASFPEGGLRRWASVVTGERLGQASATVSSIAGDPVIDGNRIYTGNISGRIAAIDLITGDRIWTATEGSAGAIWAEGGSLFFVNDLGQLMRLDAATGDPIWRVQLPGFVQSQERRQRTRYAHYGPILAGGRLIVVSTDGLMREFDPRNGALIGSMELPNGAAANPVVANNTLYIVTTRGELVALR